jgi:hypothetical protein
LVFAAGLVVGVAGLVVGACRTFDVGGDVLPETLAGLVLPLGFSFLDEAGFVVFDLTAEEVDRLAMMMEVYALRGAFGRRLNDADKEKRRPNGRRLSQ